MTQTTAVKRNVMDPPKKVGRRSNGMLLSAQEFDSIRRWDERYRYELIHGVLIVVPPAGAGERSPNDELGFLLNLHKRTHPQGHLIDLTLPEQTIQTGDNRRVADRVVWVGLGRTPDPDVDVPAIVIEFVSRSRRDQQRDYEVKRAEYLGVGVREYWVIDRYRRQFTAYLSAGDAVTLTPEQEYSSELLPGFVLRLPEVFAAADLFSRHRPTPSGGQ